MTIPFKKLNRKGMIITAISVVTVIALIAAALFVIPHLKKNDIIDAPVFKNAETKIKPTSDGVLLDGSLDDGIWKNQRFLECTVKSDSKIKLSMTSYFGDEGVYFAFDVKDNSLFYSTTRETTANSGIEFYVSSLGGADDINGTGYEIDITAGGETAIKKYLNGAYGKVNLNYSAKVKIDGKLNSFECNGYTAEILLPYGLFDGKCEKIYAMPALVRTLSAESTDRQWYCFGIEDRASEWTKASTWWSFGKNGLDALDVTLKSENGGQLEGKKFVVSGDDYTFKIMPDNGYFLSSLKINGEENADGIFYQADGAYYTVESAEKNIDVSAEFKALNTEKQNISGKITDGKNALPAKLFAVKGGFMQEIAVGSDGTFKSDIPKENGISLYCEADGYLSVMQSVTGNNVNIILKKSALGTNNNVSLNEFKDTDWDLSRLGENRVRAVTRAFRITALDTEIYSDKVSLSADISLPLRESADSRAGFVFINKSGEDAFVALTMNNEKGDGFYSLQIISKKGTVWDWQGDVADISRDQDIKTLANGKSGIRMNVYYHDGVFDIWLNGIKVAENVYAVDSEKNNIFGNDKKVAAGIQSWNNKTVFSNLKISNGEINKADIPNEGNNKLQNTANNNDTRRFTAIDTTFYNRVSVTGNLVLPIINGKDTRTGFSFRTKDGRDTFVALTLSNDKGQKEYSIQFISLDARSFETVKDTGWTAPLKNYQSETGSSAEKGVDYTVYYEKGYISVWLGGKKVASGIAPADQSGNPIYDLNDNVSVGRESWEIDGKFSDVKVSSDSPEWSIRKRNAVCKTTEQTFTLIETDECNSISADIILPTAENTDSRAGFKFVSKSGKSVFVALLMHGENGKYTYSVQLIGENRGGSPIWESKGDFKPIENLNRVRVYANSTSGVTLKATYKNGCFTISLDGKVVAENAYPITDAGRFIETTEKMQAGLECWNCDAAFKNITVNGKN